jgi:glycosyltransferase involved in cell wall biosynthesis
MVTTSVHARASSDRDLSIVAVLAASGAAPPLADTLASLAGEDALGEIIVFDAGLVDADVLDRVSSSDRRVRVRRVAEPGLIATARRAIEESTADLVVFPSTGDRLLPGVLDVLRDALVDAPGSEAAYGYSFPVDGLGRVSRVRLRSFHNALVGSPPPEFQAGGALPTFRRAAFVSLETARGESFDEMIGRAVRTAEARGTVRRVAELVCARRSAAVPGPAPAGSRTARPLRARAVGKLVRAWLARLSPYDRLASALAPRRFDALRRAPGLRASGDDLRIAYVLRKYPTLSELVIRREVAALRHAGLHVEVLAYEPNDPPVPDDPSCPAGPVTYFGGNRPARGGGILLRALRRRPFTVARLAGWIARHRYRPEKSWARDRAVLLDAARLADALDALGITHVHSPWANDVAFRSAVAARLLGLTHSVQARASEIRRVTVRYLVADRLALSEFVITNSRYNEAHLATFGARDVHVVYNGLDLERFPRRPSRTPHDGPPRVLAVGRLVEPKGFATLLSACRLLRDRGTAFTCDIIGGPESFDVATWVRLRKLHTELQLRRDVRFLGAQPFSVVRAALEEADVFVLPCVHGRDGSHDITPSAILEAMAVSLPVVSTRSGAVPELVDHERAGLLVPPGDEEALAAAIERLLGDAPLRERFGAEGRRVVEARFDARRNVERHAALFRMSGHEAPHQP